MVYEAIGLVLRVSSSTGSLVEAPLNHDLRGLGHLPWSFIVLLAGLIVVYFLYERTTIGFNIRALGGNTAVARSLGVNIDKTLLLVGLICGLLLGIASFLQQSYNGYTTVKSGLSSIQLILQPLAIALLADILQKKIHIVIAVPICAFLMFAAFNILTLMNLPSGTLQEALLALFLITFAVVGQRGVKGVVK
jgi:ribose transport system permease protein